MTEKPPEPRVVDMEKIGPSRFRATNVRGGVLPIGSGEDPDFSPVELLLAALAACGAVTLDPITSRRATAESFRARAEGLKVHEDGATRIADIVVTFDLVFPEGEAGDAARAVLPSALQRTHDRICTVSRTVEAGETVVMRLGSIPALSPVE
jgi:uncharacterized OsmC-like protein